EGLVEVAAHVEAALDFVDEDIQFIEPQELRIRLNDTVQQLRAILDRLSARGTRSRLPQVMLVGLPNAGKSSLFNALVGRSRAIVSEQAGTTRDLVSAHVQLGGIECVLADTAGIEEWEELSPRKLAQDQLNRSVASADLVLVCFDCRYPNDHAHAQQLLSKVGVQPQRQLAVATKSDLMPQRVSVVADALTCHVDQQLVEELRNLLVQQIERIQGELQSDSLHRTMVRCSTLVSSALAAIERALELLGDPFGDELVASELRHAIDELSAVIGEVHSDDILGEIFSRFCIGK
ncbi:MAG TPA: tRNA uridine-5-carboxymethylaminomethyl(34) synthesis GTPase MnmE, partial [Planctomycetaceae bacterium]|nr:tRNA uridine-5-carboxymethylaminomethyl(34) synthesis GTPase MnmE [Planctomycetaceae bacterium]